MKHETFFEKFDQFADAPDSVARMRELVRHLAVTGTLVDQDPNDESALNLLDRIAAHKTAMAKEGNLRGPTTVSPMSPDEGTRDLPASWTWVRFGEIMINRDGERIPVSKEERATKAKTYDYYGASGVIDKIDGYLFDKALLLIGEDGANLINRSTPIAFMARGQYWVNNHAHVLDGISEDFLRYIELHINAINLEPYVTGSAQPKMNQAKMNSIPIALPPLAEQKRIVAKVDELMALCDRLEAQLQERETRHAALARASLARFADAPTPANLNLLFHKSYSIPPADLRKSILTLAVQGKLVPQDANDEPARLLLERIHVEKAQLVRDGVLKRAEQMSNESEGTPTFGLPDGWEFVSLSELCTSITDGDHLPPPKTETGIPFLVISNVRWGGIEFSDTRYVSEEYFGKLDPIRKPRKGDILYTLVGSFGIPVMVNVELPFCVQRHIGILRPSSEVSEAYLVYLLASEFVLEQSSRIATGIAQKTVPLGGLRRISVPLPPLAEQRRIVAKVDELMALVDALETQLATARTTAEMLMEAVVAELTTQD